MIARRFIFNARETTALDGGAATHYLGSNEPTIALDELFDPDEVLRRHRRQRDALPAPDLAGSPDAPIGLFGDDLEQFCRAYAIRRLLVEDERETLTKELAPLGNAPLRAIEAWPAVPPERLAALGSPEGEVGAGDEVLYLFHVIVALEWVPTPQRLRRLQWAFRRASDYLYDVSNGTMAFGQVTFGGPEWMQAADIQILASNRFLPRSWVSGLLMDHKYTPIRLGRGLWVRDRRILIDWEEPEGYRAIVHEWGHYALGLKDQYLDVRQLFQEPDSTRLAPRGTPAARPLAVVVPNRRVKSESIMASVQGNSELGDALDGDRASSGNIGAVLRRHYPHVFPRLYQSWSGPGSLPLPLPHFRRAAELAGPELPAERTIFIPCAGTGEAGGPAVQLDEDAIPQGRWEIFVTRLVDGSPTRLVFQGELDARAPEQGFTLLGATPGDTVLLMSSAGPLQVWARTLDDRGDDAERRLARRQWRRIRPDLAPPGAEDKAQQPAEPGQPWEPAFATLLGATDDGAAGASAAALPPDVLPITPKASNPPEKARAQVRLRSGQAGAQMSRQLMPELSEPGPAVTHTVFGIGDREHRSTAAVLDRYELPSLDGYVVTTASRAGGRGLSGLVISDFSQGGPPGTAPSMVSDPISAGASSGEALLLCNVEGPQEQAEAYRVVTTTLRGAPLPAGIQAVSPVFSIATNIPLLTSFTPTLLIVNAFPDDGGAGDLRIYRLVDGEPPIPLPTHVAPDGASAVAPLLPEHSTLVEDAPRGGGEPRSERFVLAREREGGEDDWPSSLPGEGESAAESV